MNAFLKYAARRFAQFVFVIFTGITLAFIIAHLSPVDPVEQSLSLMTGFSGSDPRAIEILRQSLSELYGVNPLLFDLCLKRSLKHPESGARLPASVFVGNPAIPLP